MRTRGLWLIESNTSISNMDFAAFADAVEDDGIFRGLGCQQGMTRTLDALAALKGIPPGGDAHGA